MSGSPFAIREGKNREVRKVLESLGLKVNRLIRVSFGPFQLGELGDGAVKEIESQALRAELGERIVSEAACDFEGRSSITSRRPLPVLRRERAMRASRERQRTRACAVRPSRREDARVRTTERRPRVAATTKSPAATGAAGRGRRGHAHDPGKWVPVSRLREARFGGKEGRIRSCAQERFNARGRRQIAFAPDHRAEGRKPAADRGSPARVAVQYPHARLRRCGDGRTRARPLRRHRRARHRGDLARRGLRVVRR